MAQLTQELIEIHRRIEKKLSDFSAARQDSSNHQAVAAAMLLDCYFYTGAEQNRSALARMGLDADSIRGITVAALSRKKARRRRSARQRLARQKSFSRRYLCRGFLQWRAHCAASDVGYGLFAGCMLPSTSCAGRCTRRCG